MSGCASQYVQPEYGARAKITYKSLAGNNGLQVFVFDSYDCEWPKMIKSFLHETVNQEHTVYVKSGERFINTFRSLRTSFDKYNYYFTTIDFIPEENQEYEITLIGHDYMEVEVMKKHPDGKFPEKTLRKPEKVCRW